MRDTGWWDDDKVDARNNNIYDTEGVNRERVLLRAIFLASVILLKSRETKIPRMYILHEKKNYSAYIDKSR